MVHRITFVKNGKILTNEETQIIIFQKLEEIKRKNKEAKKSGKGDICLNVEESIHAKRDD
ncbi:hypothetical protein [Sporolituus thermophilus]|uniref:Uncharacterized protein n=1 Tax=Sporolituus thermophilus DSM 23256 TaxID=1123285 RepID=A0A1G7MHA5_9FIRM|nr:hypothetical protein [Sporolituus thermophilus]SDF61105.1 hypothetical protein SAMN05660235_02159 [Sporolituus thermophilus DSM 23256]